MSDKLREAALAALDWLKDKRLDTWTYMEGSQFYSDRDKQVKALEAALAEPTVQESLTVAEQEPVGKFFKLPNEIWIQVPPSSPGIFLYTAPPRREWVGLTDEEIFEIHKQVDSMQYLTFAKAIEAKLREKNT